MTSERNQGFGGQSWPQLVEQLPVGITVLDLDGRIRYFNPYSALIVDRRPELIDQDIRACHQKKTSIERIDRILNDLRSGRKKSVAYDTVRNGKTLSVTVSPFIEDGKLSGYIQSFVVK